MFRILISRDPSLPLVDIYTFYLLWDYMPKWVEAKATKTNDSKMVEDFVKSNIFARFRTPRAIICNNGLHFYNKTF